MLLKTLTPKQIMQTLGARVLVVDKSSDVLESLSRLLKPMSFELKTASSPLEALGLMSSWAPDIIITDLTSSESGDVDFFETVHRQNPLLPIIILTGHGTVSDAVAATQSGAASFITKPFNGERLIDELQQNLLASGFAQKTNLVINTTNDHRPFALQNIVSQSPKMAAIMQQIERLAPTDSIILFEGETGSGKDELARATHLLSQRADHKLMHISGSSLPEERLSIELFGKIGNGSIEFPDHRGIFRETEGGTLLLSDFNEVSPTIVFRVLSALVSKTAKPVDSEHEYAINTRILSTTSVIGRYGRFSQRSWDFWDKLDISILTVPALRERREDIPLIAHQCLASMNSDTELSFATKAMQLMLTTEWPGNVRQLISVVRQCARLCKTKVISESLVNSRISNPVFKIQSLTNAHREFERNYLTEILKATGGNVTKASQMAKRNRTEFHRLLKKHKIEAKSFRP